MTHDLMLAGVSVTRNEKLAQIFYRLSIIEAFGTGIPRIYSAYENSTVKPEIPVIDGGFLIRIPNLNFHVQPINGNSTISTFNEERLLVSFMNKSFSKEQAAEALGISKSGAYKLLQRMQKRGLLNSRKFGKKWLYSATSSKLD